MWKVLDRVIQYSLLCVSSSQCFLSWKSRTRIETPSLYSYSIKYKPGKQLCNADALSRLPSPTTTVHDCVPEDVVMVINHLSSTSANAASIKEWTAKDPIMSCVLRFLLTGWPDQNQKLDKEYQPYSIRKHELSVLDGCILWASRVIVPPPGRQLLLEELHESHPGISKMKALARSYVWWPGIHSDIEKLVKSCQVCQESRASPAPAPLHPWEWPSQPWSRIHLDFAGPFLGHQYLVLVDAHSKWIDVHMMNSITSTKTIEKLRIIFANFGLPRKVVTDNGTSSTSAEFKSFMSDNNIVHITTAPYHPSSNGLAERAVQTFKNGLKRTKGATIQERIFKFLLTYRITPQTTTGVAPAQLLMGRRPRSRLDRLFPDLSHRLSSMTLPSHSVPSKLMTLYMSKIFLPPTIRGFLAKWSRSRVHSLITSKCNRAMLYVVTWMQFVNEMLLFHLLSHKKMILPLL